MIDQFCINAGIEKGRLVMPNSQKGSIVGCQELFGKFVESISPLSSKTANLSFSTRDQTIV